jgi:hypothetical protein
MDGYGYNSEDDLLSGPQRGLSGFLETSDAGFGFPAAAAAAPAAAAAAAAAPAAAAAAAAAGFASPAAAAAGFASPGSAASAYMALKCNHGLKRNSCSKCFQTQNELRESLGDAPKGWGIFCRHGFNKYVNKALAKKDPSGLGRCGDPECIATKPYKRVEHLEDLEDLGDPEEQGSSADVPNVNLFGTKVFYDSDNEDMGRGGKKKYRKLRSVKKSKRSSRKYRKSSRKYRKSSRKYRKSSRK